MRWIALSVVAAFVVGCSSSEDNDAQCADALAREWHFTATRVIAQGDCAPKKTLTMTVSTDRSLSTASLQVEGVEGLTRIPLSDERSSIHPCDSISGGIVEREDSRTSTTSLFVIRRADGGFTGTLETYVYDPAAYESKGANAPELCKVTYDLEPTE